MRTHNADHCYAHECTSSHNKDAFNSIIRFRICRQSRLLLVQFSVIKATKVKFRKVKEWRTIYSMLHAHGLKVLKIYRGRRAHFHNQSRRGQQRKES